MTDKPDLTASDIEHMRTQMAASQQAFERRWRARPWRERLWSWLGFGYPSPTIGYDDDDEDRHWYFGSTTICHWGWPDRLRLLVSGKTMVRVSHRTDAEIHQLRSSSAATVLPPGFLTVSYHARMARDAIPVRPSQADD